MAFRRRPARSGYKPTRTWVSLANGWSFSNVSTTSTSVLMSLEAPTTLNLTSDPPEDVTVLRIVGDYLVLLTASPATWTLALLVQDQTWTPTTFAGDADKRILWSKTYFWNGSNVSAQWFSSLFVSNGDTVTGCHPEMTRVDIAPKVRLEPGKALFLVAYETSGAASFSTDPGNVRMLFQRSGRR